MPKKKPDESAAETATEKPAAKPQAERAPVKKTAAKKAPANKTAAEKAPAKKAPAKKTAAKQTAAKKTPAKKSPAAAPAAEETAPAEKPTATPEPADNPLYKKLGMRPGVAGVVVAPPDDNDNPLAPLPDGFRVVTQTDELEALDGPFDYLHVFARDRGDLATVFPVLRDKLAPNGSLWVSWLKQSSGRGGVFGDLNENIVRRMALMNGMVDTKLAGLDRNWAALRLVHRKH